MARRRPVGRRGLPVVTSEGCSYSGTWSWVKLVSVPESPPLGLYDTVPVQHYRQLHVKCCAFEMFHWTEVVQVQVYSYYSCTTKGGIADAPRVRRSYPPGKSFLHAPDRVAPGLRLAEAWAGLLVVSLVGTQVAQQYRRPHVVDPLARMHLGDRIAVGLGR